MPRRPPRADAADGLSRTERATAAARSRGPAHGEAILRAQRRFALNRRSHRNALILTIVMAVVAVGCLITWFALNNSQHPLWPWATGVVVALAIGVSSFARQTRLVSCPHCHTHLLGIGGHCPYCGVGIDPEAGTCQACKASLSETPRLSLLSCCTTCGTMLVSTSSRPRAADTPE